MFKVIVFFSLILVWLFPEGIQASPRHGYIPPYVSTGKMLIGGFGPNSNGTIFLNIAKGWASQNFNGGLPSQLNANGYLITAPTANIGGQFYFPIEYTGNIKISWTGTGAITLNVPNPGTTVSLDPNACSSVGVHINNTPISGTNCAVTFTFNTTPPTNLSAFFPTGQTYSGMSNLVICRSGNATPDDCSRIASGQIFNVDFLASMKSLNNKWLRAMGWTLNGGIDALGFTNYLYRTPVAALSYLSSTYPPGAWGGTVSGTDTYTAGPAPDSPAGAYVLGETIQASFTNANLTTSPTLNINSRGAIPIVGSNGLALSAGSIAANSVGTLIYDDLLNEFLYIPGGMITGVPVEIQVALANALGENLHYNFSVSATQASVTWYVNYIAANLNSNLSAAFEVSNELWNFAFAQSHMIFAKGLALGFPNANNEPLFGYDGLAVRQTMANVTTTWTAAGRSTSQLKRVMAFQAYGLVSGTQTYLMNGTDLNTGLGYTKYNSYVGVSYTANGQRPVDWVDELEYAPYYSGSVLTNFDANYTNTNIAGLTTAADNYTSGGSGVATAFTWIDNDINNCSLNTSGCGSNSTNNTNYQTANIFPAWETVAASYDTYRVGVPQSRLLVGQYENAMEAAAPSAAKCVALGGTIATSSGTLYCGNTGEIQTMLNDYKTSSALFKATVLGQLNNFMSTAPGGTGGNHADFPAWLITDGPAAVNNGPGQWQLLQGDYYSTPFQSWTAVQQFN